MFLDNVCTTPRFLIPITQMVLKQKKKNQRIQNSSALKNKNIFSFSFLFFFFKETCIGEANAMIRLTHCTSNTSDIQQPKDTNRFQKKAARKVNFHPPFRGGRRVVDNSPYSMLKGIQHMAFKNSQVCIISYCYVNSMNCGKWTNGTVCPIKLVTVISHHSKKPFHSLLHSGPHVLPWISQNGRLH